ncbi:aspartate aminotransferase family protein [Paenibacillus sp. GSMTC-2017]|uniref:aspartate aminotransferase family protein n=1 Tax=Paenibacillus sp. GSMTC-2017 TaxID=2794350 RepID=UPI0018D7F35B|nr:aspartate aminotransferase family protein [Paenibacillus sp. GSMTC-2017]MBH5320100.1 aspartate aminotransferase family protein [Paenibacillus sp. GSMTC-2017]
MERGNSFYLNSQSSWESNARSYPRKIPIAITWAKGIMVRDADGKSYYDCLSGAGTLALGHNHPVVIEAMQETLRSGLPLHTLDLTTPMKQQFVEELFQCLPSKFANRAKIQFCGPTGADGVEAAIKLVKTATGRRNMMSFHGGYHGMTNGALSLTGNLSPKQHVANLMPDVQFMPYPYNYRCPFGVGGDEGHRIGSRYMEHVLNDPESGIVRPAGMIIEVVQGEGGVIPAPVEWLREIRRMTCEREIPLIIDEVQTGLGRTGKMFAFEHADITPDVLVLSKAIGGSLPLAVIIYDESLDQWQPGAHAGTFRGNQLGMAAGIATIQFIKQNQIDKHAEKVGDLFQYQLVNVKSDTSCIGEVRGKGLMIGVEIVNKEGTPDHLGSYPAYPELAKMIQQQCVSRGLIVELGGRYGSVVRFLPPLIITDEQVHDIIAIFHDAVTASERAIISKLVEVLS